MARPFATVGFVVALALASAVGVGAGAGVAAAQSGTETVTVTVAVRDQADDPISNAELDVEWDGGSTTATTAGNGKAFVDVPADAEVSIRVTHPQYVRMSPYVVSSASEREVEVEVFRKSSVRLEVGDDDGAVADAQVLVERGGLDVATGTTGPNGVFESDVIRAGDYTITVSKPGYYTRQKPLEIRGNITNRVALRSGSATVGVTVTDPHFDPPRPVPDATVNISGVGTVQSDRAGEVAVTAPVNTDTTLRVTKDGYRTVERRLQVGEENANVSVGISRVRSLALESTNDRMVAGERVVLTVTNAYDEPVEGATIVLDGEAAGATDAGGEAAIRVDDPGNHTLRAESSGVRSNQVQVEAIDADGEDATPTTTATATPTTTATATPTATTTSGTSPGFAPVLVILALLLVAARLARR